MRISAIAVTMFGMQMSLFAFSQKEISISVRKEPLRNVLSLIEKESEYRFLYEENPVFESARVSLRVDKASIDVVLKQILAGTGLNYTINQKGLVVLRTTGATEKIRPVNGVVVNVKGEPLPGISITVKKSSKGTSTNSRGEFSIDAEPGDVLVFSSIGFTPQEFTVHDESLITIRLIQTTSQMTDVVVVGYGSQTKEKITGAVSTLGGEEIRKMPVTNNTQSLAGKIPGLISLNTSGHPGTGSSISIRGQSSYNDAEALYVIDGTIRNSSNFSELDPNDIESISVLKDAGSAAVYGVRATNGVIVVTTRHGRLGKPVFSLSTSLSDDRPTRYPGVMNAYQYAVYQKAASENMGATPLYTDQQIQDFKTGVTPSTDWEKVAFGNHALTSMSNLNMSGGSEAIKYFVSFGYTNQDGIYPNVGYRRYNLRTNLDIRINKTLSAAVNIEGKVSDNFAPNISDANIWTFAAILPSSIPAYNPDGSPHYDPIMPQHPGAATRGTGYNKNLDNLFVGGLTLTQQLPFLKGLAAKGGIQVWEQYGLNKVWNLPYNLYDSTYGGAAHTLNGQTSLTEALATYNTYTLDLSLDYARSFGKHSVKGLILYEQFAEKGDNFSAYRTNYVINTIDQLFAGANDNTLNNNGTASQDGRQSVVGRVNYDYDARYLFEASFRDDASWRFAPGKRWGFFPSLSAGWILSKEAFMEKFKGLDFLKLRGTWGILGNDNVGGFQYLSSYSLNSSIPYFFGPTTTPQTLIIPGVVPNPALTWESTSETNLGIDAVFLHKLIGFSFDAFQKDTYNMYLARNNQFPGVYGATIPSQNYGKMNVRGWELTLTHENKVGEVSYGVSGNLSFSRNRVKQIDYSPNPVPWLNPIGKPVNYYTGYVADGLYQTNEQAATAPHIQGTNPKAGDIRYEDLNHDGIIDYRDQKVLSWNAGTPEVMYGLTIDASWKSFSLNVFFQGVANRDLMYTNYMRDGLLNGNSFAYFMNYWSPSNPGGKYPEAWQGRNPVNDVNSSYWLRSGSFVRLKNVQLSYSLPAVLAKRANLTNVRFFISGSNLAVFSSIKDFDPEMDAGAGGFYYPQNKSLVAGINVSF